MHQRPRIRLAWALYALCALGATTWMACGDSFEEDACDPAVGGASCVCTDDWTGAACDPAFDSEGTCTCALVDSNGGYSNTNSSYTSTNSGTTSTNGQTSTNNSVVIPEPEERLNFQRPESSQSFVFVANTALDTVAMIDGDSLEITSLEVGDRPTVVRTSRANNTAVVLNEGSATVNAIYARSSQDVTVSSPLLVREGFNNIVLAPGGDHALAYLDYAEVSLEDDVSKFQDVNLIRLGEGEEEVFNISVGFRVLEIEFDAEGRRAYIITEDGISVVELGAVREDIDAQPIAVTDAPALDGFDEQREVEITADGNLALVRTTSLEGLNLVALAGRRGDIRFLPLGGVPTDLDLYPDSSAALVTVPGARQVVRMELGEALDDPEAAMEIIDIPEGPLGLAALDVATGTALLYSIALQSPEVVRLDLETGEQEVWDLRKAVQGVQLSADGARALVLHDNSDTPRSSAESDVFIAESFGYTILDIATGFTKLQTTAAALGEFVFTPDSEWAFLALEDPSLTTREIQRVNLRSFRVDSYTLATPPVHIGLVPSTTTPRVYVSQEHPSGRMTFFEVESGSARTVTGYELNGQID